MATKAESHREGLAEYAHKAWSGWMDHLFKNSVRHADGSVTIPRTLVDRWMRQMRTPYAELSENEKRSDLKEADRMIETIDGPKKNEVGRKEIIEDTA